MLQVVARHPNGGSMLVLVLEPGNIHRMKEGSPIEVHVDSLFPDGVPNKLPLRIYFSETPVADSREFAKIAQVAIDERSVKRVLPHCPECKSTVEQMAASRGPVNICFCPVCGCTLGTYQEAQHD